MKIDFIIISSILVIISFLPFVLFPIIGSKVVTVLKKKFKEEALSRELNISYQLQWNVNLAGVDILKKQFLWIQKNNENFEIKQIDLNKISEVKLITQTVLVKEHKKQVQILSKVELEFYAANSIAPVIVTVFDHDINYNQDFELKNAEKLVAELKKYVTVQPVLKLTA